MSKSQKVLKIFGVLELLLAALGVVIALQGGGAVSWVSFGFSLVTAVALLQAAKDASKITGAWLLVLVALILSVADLVLALNGGADKVTIIGTVIAIILNLIAFIAAHNVKKQAKQ